MFKSASKVTINTGNVLNLIDLKKKAGQNVTEELSESIKLTLTEWGSQNKLAQQQTNGTAAPNDAQFTKASSTYMIVSAATTSKEAVINITRPHDDVQNKMAEEERKNLKIGVKIFINEDSPAALTECLENVFLALQTDTIENVILSYNPDLQHLDIKEENSGGHDLTRTPIALKNNSAENGLQIVHVTSSEIEADNEADARKCEAILPGIKTLWAVLEDYVKDGRVQQLGVADVGGGCLRVLHGWARVRPAIAQVGLASCCVVPPALQAFCRSHDVQLLTHSDPPDLLTKAAVKALSEAGFECHTLDWCARYQVQIKCRGVLALKGYVCKGTTQPKSSEEKKK